jgi:hypothetical protein
MNGSRAGTADRARAADIVNAEPPPDERGDSSGPQARYRAPETGWTRAKALAARPSSRRSTPGLADAAAHPADVPKFRYRPLSEVRPREALLIREFRVVYM